MPPVIIAAVSAIGAGIGGTFGAALIMGAVQIGTALSVLATVGLAVYQKRRAQAKAIAAYNKGLTDRLVMVSTTDAAGSIVLGRVRTVDGVIFKGSHGENLGRYVLVIALARHRIDAVEEIYFGDQRVELNDQNLVVTEPWGRIEKVSHKLAVTVTPEVAHTFDLGQVWRPGTVHVMASGNSWRSQPVAISSTSGTSITFTCPAGYSSALITWQADEQASSAAVGWYLGGDDQDISGPLGARFPALITAAHRFRGIALLFIDLSYDTSDFPTGIPAISAVIRGARVYDPRTGITAWSENPALCARHIALHPNGGAAFEDEIDDDAVIAAANACDVMHTYVDSNGVSTTRPMYTCSYVASTEVSPDIHMGEIVEAMAGKWGWAGGRLRMRAGTFSAPVASITDDWMAPGQRQIIPGVGQRELVNIMRPTISDSAQAYVAAPIAPVRAEAYISADGMELPQETTLSAVSFAPQAQHVCAVQMRDMRQGMTLSWPVNMRAFALELFDVVTVTSSLPGLANKAFEVVGWGFTLDAAIQLTLKETGASIYQPDDVFPVDDPEPNTSLPKAWKVPTVSGVEIDSGTDQLLLQDDGTVVGRVLITFDPIEDDSILKGGQIEVQHSLDGQTWTSVMFDGGMTQLYLYGLQDGGVYLFKVRAFNKLCAGGWSDQVAHWVLGKGENPADVSGFTAATVTGGVRLAWAPSAELDYSHTQLRLGATWTTATVLADRVVDHAWVWPWPGDGTYTVLARHIDTSGNSSSATSSATIALNGQDIAIETGQILDNAATEVLQTSLTEGYTDALSSTPFVTYEVEAGWTVLVSIDFDWIAFNSTGGGLQVRGNVGPSIEVFGGSFSMVGAGAGVVFGAPIAPSQTLSGFGTRKGRYLVTAGGTLSLRARCSQFETGTPGTCPATVRKLDVIVEIVKK